MRHTKIVATIGPASSSDTALRDLVAAGVDVFRLNFSHGTHETHAEVITRIRGAADESRRCIAILQDLSGPKIRTGPLAGGKPIELKRGDELRVVTGDFPGGPGYVSTSYADLPKSVRPGDTLLLDDGRIELRVEDSDTREIRTRVVQGGPLGEHKGINAPGVPLPSAGLTQKDAEDLVFGVRAGVDFVALSFVQSAADLRLARDALARAGAPDLPLVAKLERPEAIKHLEEILQACDAVMVARGDLGLEMPLERVPRVQKEITRRARAAGIPVIVATQVLESMRSSLRPTRAEVSDAANAVDDGVDAIMLAGETAIGEYPVRTVMTLDAIIRDAEAIPPVRSFPLEDTHLLSGHGRALCEAAVTLAEHGDASAIVAVTRGGKTARVLSALRPRAPIYSATDEPLISRRLTLWWGVVPVLEDLSGDVDEAAIRIGQRLVEHSAVPPSAVIVLVRISPDLTDGKSNFLKLHRI
ncbi:MAG TPA: pyruvate kinase [Vicinamibacterales bacterium]|nr:pyruvate kinase [Vicinamibacterales bacterium]